MVGHPSLRTLLVELDGTGGGCQVINIELVGCQHRRFAHTTRAWKKTNLLSFRSSTLWCCGWWRGQWVLGAWSWKGLFPLCRLCHLVRLLLRESGWSMWMSIVLGLMTGVILLCRLCHSIRLLLRESGWLMWMSTVLGLMAGVILLCRLCHLIRLLLRESGWSMWMSIVQVDDGCFHRLLPSWVVGGGQLWGDGTGFMGLGAWPGDDRSAWGLAPVMIDQHGVWLLGGSMIRLEAWLDTWVMDDTIRHDKDTTITHEHYNSLTSYLHLLPCDSWLPHVRGMLRCQKITPETLSTLDGGTAQSLPTALNSIIPAHPVYYAAPSSLYPNAVSLSTSSVQRVHGFAFCEGPAKRFSISFQQSQQGQDQAFYQILKSTQALLYNTLTR